jgi:hypothetical protein
MTVDHETELQLIEASRAQRIAWAKLMPGVPMPKKESK